MGKQNVRAKKVYCFYPLRIATASHDSTVRIWEKESRGKNKLKTGVFPFSYHLQLVLSRRENRLHFLGCEKLIVLVVQGTHSLLVFFLWQTWPL